MKVPKKATADMSKFPRLPEMQPLIVEIETPSGDDKPNPEYLDEQYQNQPRKNVQFRMRVIDGPYAGDGTDDNPPGKVWGKHGFTLGKKKNGESSMLRQLVVAARPDLIQGKDEESAADALHDFDLDELRGERLIVIGRYGEDDAEKIYLRPIAYSSAPPEFRRSAGPRAVAQSSGNGYQVSPDGKYRWREGMANWEPIPAAAPLPPPVPTVSAPPPPPPSEPPAPPAATTSAAPAPPPPGAGKADF